MIKALSLVYRNNTSRFYAKAIKFFVYCNVLNPKRTLLFDIRMVGIVYSTKLEIIYMHQYDQPTILKVKVFITVVLYIEQIYSRCTYNI